VPASGITIGLVIAVAVAVPMKALVMYMPEASPRCLPLNHEATIFGVPTERNGPPVPTTQIAKNRVWKLVAKDCRNADKGMSAIATIIAFFIPARSIRMPTGMLKGM